MHLTAGSGTCKELKIQHLTSQDTFIYTADNKWMVEETFLMYERWYSVLRRAKSHCGYLDGCQFHHKTAGWMFMEERSPFKDTFMKVQYFFSKVETFSRNAFFINDNFRQAKEPIRLVYLI